MEQRLRSSGAHPYWVVESAGLLDGMEMHFNPGINMCGTIQDGVSFNIGNGAWVIPYAELLEMVRLASEQRGQSK